MAVICTGCGRRVGGGFTVCLECGSDVVAASLPEARDPGPALPPPPAPPVDPNAPPGGAWLLADPGPPLSGGVAFVRILAVAAQVLLAMQYVLSVVVRLVMLVGGDAIRTGIYGTSSAALAFGAVIGVGVSSAIAVWLFRRARRVASSRRAADFGGLRNGNLAISALTIVGGLLVLAGGGGLASLLDAVIPVLATILAAVAASVLPDDRNPLVPPPPLARPVPGA